VRAWIAEGWEAVFVSVSGSAEPAADPASGPPGSESRGSWRIPLGR
jgi:hypothetical protein